MIRQPPSPQHHFLQILLKESFVNGPFRLGYIVVRDGKKEDAGAGHVQRLAYFIEGAFGGEGSIVLYAANGVGGHVAAFGQLFLANSSVFPDLFDCIPQVHLFLPFFSRIP